MQVSRVYPEHVKAHCGMHPPSIMQAHKCVDASGHLTHLVTLTNEHREPVDRLSTSHLEDLYESIEQRRAQAASKCRHLKVHLQDKKQALIAAQQAHAAQLAVVASLKQGYAAMAYLAVSLTDEVPIAQVHVHAAEVLTSKCPSTAVFATEAHQLTAGFKRSVDAQAALAQEARQDMANIARELLNAQQALPHLLQCIEMASQDLNKAEDAYQECYAAYKLLLFPKQWSRYKW